MTEKRPFKTPRRSFLFVPGDSTRKIAKAAQLPTDVVILDLEDAVAVNQKEAARREVAQVLGTLDFGRRERLVRLNSLDTDFWRDDLQALAGLEVDGVVLPKVETAVQIFQVEQQLTAMENARHLPEGTIRLWAIIETAMGILNSREIAQANFRLDGLMFGAEDLAVSLGVTRSSEGWEVYHGRATVVMAAAAYRLQAVDTVFVALNDEDGLARDAAFARQLGYTGKMAIHPNQLDVLNRVFTPTTDEIAQAQRLVAAYQEQTVTGSGVMALNGRMVDRPMVRAAEKLLQRARLAGVLPLNHD